jgi:hypothetical protein
LRVGGGLLAEVEERGERFVLAALFRVEFGEHEHADGLELGERLGLSYAEKSGGGSISVVGLECLEGQLLELFLARRGRCEGGALERGCRGT